MDSITTQQVDSWLEDFLKNITPKWSPELIYLFGSRTRGSPLVFSDVDLLIVSKKFQNYNFRERKAALLQEWNGLVDLELICLTPEEFHFKKKQIGIIQEIIKTGKELYTS